MIEQIILIIVTLMAMAEITYWLMFGESWRQQSLFHRLLFPWQSWSLEDTIYDDKYAKEQVNNSFLTFSLLRFLSDYLKYILNLCSLVTLCDFLNGLVRAAQK